MKLDWPLTFLIIVAMLLFAFLAVLIVTRGPRRQHFRFGFFLERGTQESEGPPCGSPPDRSSRDR